MKESATTVKLCDLDESHAEKMLAWMQTPEVADNVGLRTSPSLPRTLAWIANAQTDASIRAWAIHVSGEHVGNIVLERIDNYVRSARLSIYIGEASARGRGVGAAAIRAALERGFAELGLHRIWLTVHERNGRALALYLRAGFRLEGVCRDDFLLRGEFVNAILMSILEGEFTR